MTVLDPTLTEQSAEESSRSPLGRIIPWLIVVSLAALFLPLYLLSTAIKEDNATLESELAASTEALERGPTVNSEEKELNDLMTDTLERISAISVVQSSLTQNHVDWPAVMASIGNYNDNYMIILAITHSGVQVSLRGRAWNEPTVISYVNRLDASDLFRQVTIRSIATTFAPDAPAAEQEDDASETPGPKIVRYSLDAPMPGAKYVEFEITAELATTSP